MELRPYQVNFINDIRRSLSIHKRILACAATGAGKTVIFISIIKMAIEKGRTVLVITESRKIFKQIIKQQHGRLIASGTDSLMIKKGQVYIAMAQTLKRREKMIDNFKWLKDDLLIISDECHVATANPILEKIDESFLIGFTATPDSKASPFLPKIYKDIVIGPQPLELVKSGYLAKYKHLERQVADIKGLKVGSNGEYTEKSLEAVFDTRFVFEGMLQDLRERDFRKCVIFCSSIKHCEHVYDQLVANGYECACVHSKRDDNEIDKFTKGSARIAVSVGQITKGFDFEMIDLICLDRSIYSLPLYLQCLGRGSRIVPGSGKEFFTVLDYGMNFTYHGSWIEDRDWIRLFNPRPKKEKKGVASVKHCLECECIIPASVRICPFCGYEHVKEELPPPESILVEVVNPLYNDVRGKMISEITPDELKIYAEHLDKKKFAIKIARWREQTEKGFLKSYGQAMGYKPSFYYMQRKIENDKIKDFELK